MWRPRMLERAARLRYLLAEILVVTIPQQWIFSKRLKCLPLVVSAEGNGEYSERNPAFFCMSRQILSLLEQLHFLSAAGHLPSTTSRLTFFTTFLLPLWASFCIQLQSSFAFILIAELSAFAFCNVTLSFHIRPSCFHFRRFWWDPSVRSE